MNNDQIQTKIAEIESDPLETELSIDVSKLTRRLDHTVPDPARH